MVPLSPFRSVTWSPSRTPNCGSASCGERVKESPLNSGLLAGAMEVQMKLLQGLKSGWALSWVK